MYGDGIVAQMAAYLLGKAGQGGLSRIKLMKLMYLTDREALARRTYAISDDRFVSMHYGPVLSHAYDLMKGDKSVTGEWEDLICHGSSEEDGRDVPWLTLRKPVSRQELGHLSPHACEVMDHIWEKFGSMSAFQLVEHTHSLPEWQDPGNSSHEIPLAAVLEALGYSKEHASDLQQFAAEQRQRDHLMTKMQFGRSWNQT